MNIVGPNDTSLPDKCPACNAPGETMSRSLSALPPFIMVTYECGAILMCQWQTESDIRDTVQEGCSAALDAWAAKRNADRP